MVSPKPDISLVQLIHEASFLEESQKNEFLELSTTLNKVQYKELYTFFLESAQKMHAIQEKYEKIRQQIYQTYMTHVKSTLAEAKQYIIESSETVPISDNDRNYGQNLLNGLLKIFKPPRFAIPSV